MVDRPDQGTAAIVLGLFAGVFLLASLVSFCPLYQLLIPRYRTVEEGMP